MILQQPFFSFYTDWALVMVIPTLRLMDPWHRTITSAEYGQQQLQNLMLSILKLYVPVDKASLVSL